MRRQMPKPQRLDLNHPPTAVWGIRESRSRWCMLDLNIPQLPLGGFERVAAAGVCWTLTIPQLPLGGFQAQRQNGQSRAYDIRVIGALSTSLTNSTARV